MIDNGKQEVPSKVVYYSNVIGTTIRYLRFVVLDPSVGTCVPTEEDGINELHLL